MTKPFHWWEVNLIIPEGYTLWKWHPESSASEVRGPEPSSFPIPNLSHLQNVICPSLAPAPHPWMHQFMPMIAVPRLYWLPNQILILHQPYSGGLALERWALGAQGWRRKMSQGKLHPSPISPQSNELGSRELQPSPTHPPTCQSLQSLSPVRLFASPWTAVRQASLSITNSQSPPKPMSIVSVMPWTISSSAVPFSSCPQSFPASGSFQMSQLFAWGGQSTGVSASTSGLPMNTQDWSPVAWTGWIYLQSKGLSRVFSNTTVQKHQFFSAQLSL